MAAFPLPTAHGSELILLNSSEARTRFRRPDIFVESMSDFDRQARLRSMVAVSQEQYLDYIGQQLLDWDADSILQVSDVVIEIQKMSLLRYFSFPPMIYVLLTNGNDENNKAYCRGSNIIVLSRFKTSIKAALAPSLEATVPPPVPETDPSSWAKSLTHELFHIWSRNNLQLRNKLYESIGYHVSNQLFELPFELQPLKMTNPDVATCSEYIKVQIDGVDTNVTPVLYAKRPYDGGGFFDYLQARLLILTEDLKSIGRTIGYKEIEGFYEQVGRNTTYIIHPEEIMADNFVLLIKEAKDVSSPEVLDKMKTILSIPI